MATFRCARMSHLRAESDTRAAHGLWPFLTRGPRPSVYGALVPSSRARWIGLLGGAAVLLGGLGVAVVARAVGYFDAPFDPSRLELGPTPPHSHEPRATVRAFYSGHSLSDGIPAEVQAIAQSRAQNLDYQFQSIPGSLIRQRTKGEDPDAPDWPGFRAGKNRSGSGLNVEAELQRRPAHGPNPDAYDVLVVTERHDLPYAIYHEHTIEYLRLLQDRLIEGNPQAQDYLYHSWLEIDLDAPEHFVTYERAALPLWECVASAVNRGLEADGRRDRVRVLPGATALAELVEQLARGTLPGASGATARERIQPLFSDQVHLTPLGRYFIGAVHYAVLFQQTPEGSPAPAGVSPELAHELTRIAWQHVSAYEPRAAAAAQRGAAVCTDYAVQVMCPAFAAHPRNESSVSVISKLKQNWLCRRGFAPEGASPPFR
jgi:hypothetical protein